MSPQQGFLWNIWLMAIWVAATESLTTENFLAGFIIGFIVLLFLQRLIGPARYFRKVRRIVAFLWFLTVELYTANIKMMQLVISRNLKAQPGIIGVHLDITNETQIAFLAALITLTPGTITLEASADLSILYIHSMFVHDRDIVEKTIKDTFECQVKELFE